jgi:hypothetical protein
MKSGRFSFKNAFWLAAMIIFIVAARDLAQQIPTGHSDAFKTDMYFDHPHEQQVQTRLSGAEATPLPGGLLDVKDLRLESYSTNGLLQLVAKAPQCTYAMLDGRANSPGHLEMQSGDGKFYIEGDGFLLIWRQNATSLTISNQVHTLIQTGLLPP